MNEMMLGKYVPAMTSVLVMAQAEKKSVIITLDGGYTTDGMIESVQNGIVKLSGGGFGHDCFVNIASIAAIRITSA